MTARAAALLGAMLLAAAPAAAAPRAQVVGAVQRMLDATGHGDVDARALSTRQVAAIYLQLQGPALEPAGLHGLEARQRVRVILGWD